jgi:CheY-like chemotaxis protein
MSGKKQILWVDDEIEFLRAHIIFLEDHNYDVAKAHNGDDAIELIKEKHFDLIFLDEQMPGKDGLTTLEEIKAFKPKIPVVMVTKSEEEQLMEEAFGRNIDGYLTKPVNPSQILSVCKSILHSRVIKKTHITSEYVSEYAEFKAILMNNQFPQNWFSLFHALCKWDVNLQTVKDQGLEETHLNHKKEVSSKFVRFVENNYLRWHGGREENPFLITHSFKRKVFPLIKKHKKVCSVVMTGFRMDQWLTVKNFLEAYFTIDENHAWTLIPSERLYCRTALFSGKTSLSISLDHPNLWKKLKDEERHREYEKELLKLSLANNGIQNIDDPVFKYIRSTEDSQEFLRHIDQYNHEPLIVLVIEFPELLLALRKESSLLMEIAPDEMGLRELTKLWFQSSDLLKILGRFSETGRSVVLTSDHGSIMVRTPVEVFFQEDKSPHPRLKIGKGISCDERRVFFIESPRNFGLPGEDQKLGYVIAKQDSYFIYPNKYHYIGTRFKGQMVSGGLSMEEMLVPLITLTPASR